jgi:glycosyltransferase involved in cell wall biosynthesis
MHIVIAGQTYYPASNGQAVFTTHLAEGLALAGHQVMAIVPSDGRQAHCRFSHGVQVQAVSSIPLAPVYPDVYFTLFPGRQVGRLLDEFRPDVVHIQDLYPSGRAVVGAARRRQIRTIGTNHFLPENIVHYLPAPAWSRPLLNRILWATMLEVYNRLDLATTPTETAARILRRQRIRVPVHPVSCGVDLNRFRPDPAVDRAGLRQRYGLDPARAVFLFVGRIDQEKRLDVLLKAVPRLARDDVQLGIVGRGRHTQALQALAGQLDLGDRAVFTGYVPAEDLPALLNSVDVFAMPSEAELQSIATLEAMACGRPILAANARALPELVENGVNGYLFRPGGPADAARRMVQLVEERDRWPAFGAASLARARVHSLGHTVQRYLELYRSLNPAARPVGVPLWPIAAG